MAGPYFYFAKILDTAGYTNDDGTQLLLNLGALLTLVSDFTLG